LADEAAAFMVAIAYRLYRVSEAGKEGQAYMPAEQQQVMSHGVLSGTFKH